jgi:uncharacterized membrane protein (Fun14 family)
MSEIVSPLGYQFGIGGIGGFIVGYAIKKISKLIVILIGLFAVALIYLSTQGIIDINYQALLQASSKLIGEAPGAVSWFARIISVLPFTASFLVGFLIGLKLG